MLGPAFIVSPGLLQKVYAARSDAAVRVGVGINAVVLLVFAAGPPLLGMIAHAHFPLLPDPDLALPTLLVETLPPLVGAFGLAALFSAEVSSSDAILFMLSTSLSRDLYQRFVRPSASDADLPRAARWTAITGGLLGTGLAIVSESIAGALGLLRPAERESVRASHRGVVPQACRPYGGASCYRGWDHRGGGCVDRHGRPRHCRTDAGNLWTGRRDRGMGNGVPHKAIRVVTCWAA